jgi:hypothetical protein
MFYSKQIIENQEQYQKFLRIVGCLSNLFSDSKIPYLYYRVAEKIFCRAFDAEDLSRSDVSADAQKDKIGIGLKTFLIQNDKTFQKVAEFGGDRDLYINLEPKELIKKVSDLRNARIDFTEKTHDMESSIYHCVVRDAGKFKIFEEKMDRVDIHNIGNIKKNKSSIRFDDGIHEYSFSLPKSTLMKRFETKNTQFEFNVDVLLDPLTELQVLLQDGDLSFQKEKRIKETVYLPLYGRNQEVFEKSGLNQWNAGGRKRNSDEVYIPVPIVIHKIFPNFFPKRDVSFLLRFPDKEEVEAKICQENGKALMTNPNKKLGKLILRDGLKLKEGELATYEKLQLLGIDSVRIDKIGDLEFEINFSKNGSYERFFERFI